VGLERLDLNCTVIGFAESGKARGSFLRYLEDVRLAPPRTNRAIASGQPYMMVE
jgi:hypothetical protein